MGDPVIVRPARAEDQPRILEIYNREVAFSTATYDTTPRSREEQDAWLAHHDARHPVLVAVVGDRVGGWASLSPWSDRAAYDSSAEVSVYVAEESRRRGIGRILLGALIDAGKLHGFHALLARISADNEASVRLHAALGFSTVGMLKEAGIKFGRLLDVAIMELVL